MQTAPNASQNINPQQTAGTIPPSPAPISQPATPQTNDDGIRSIGTILLAKGLITPEQLKSAQLEVAQHKGTMESIIQSKNWVGERDLVLAKSEIYNIPFVDITSEDITSDVLQKLPYEVAKAHSAIVFKQSDQGFDVAMEDPLDVQRSRYLGLRLGGKIKEYFAVPSDLENIIETKYGARIGAEVEEALAEVGTQVVNIEQTIRNVTDVQGELKRAPVPRIVNMILEYAATFKASDVHIEPRENKVAIRYRINGILAERQTLPLSLGASVVTRIKILADLKIDEHRIPQDGRFQIKVGEKQLDLRVSVMPTVYGEKVVIRLLEKDGKMLTLENAGLRGMALRNYKNMMKGTEGIILITGPTGSGKTQTLASTLALLNRPSVNIITLEDPVEIRIDGVNQVQINADVGLTFAKGLRSFLRQDPDIIMVGEIRDKETAGLAVQGALVGRLVLSTLHTNNAAGALPRLLDMEVEPFLLASTINMVVAQRLVRKICPYCIAKYEAPAEVVKDLHKVLDGLRGFDMYSYPKRDHQEIPPGQIPKNIIQPVMQQTASRSQAVLPNQLNRPLPQPAPLQPITLYKGQGCPKCNNTGYQSRIGIFEVLLNNEKISKLIMEHRSAASIEQQAIADGMITMKQDGYMKALEGITTMEEILRVQNN